MIPHLLLQLQVHHPILNHIPTDLSILPEKVTTMIIATLAPIERVHVRLHTIILIHIPMHMRILLTSAA